VRLQESFCHGEDGVDGGLVASFLAATASSSARSFPLLCAPPLLECPLTFLPVSDLDLKVFYRILCVSLSAAYPRIPAWLQYCCSNLTR
jgi:hypothetical protein